MLPSLKLKNQNTKNIENIKKSIMRSSERQKEQNTDVDLNMKSKQQSLYNDRDVNNDNFVTLDLHSNQWGSLEKIHANSKSRLKQFSTLNFTEVPPNDSYRDFLNIHDQSTQEFGQKVSIFDTGTSNNSFPKPLNFQNENRLTPIVQTQILDFPEISKVLFDSESKTSKQNESKRYLNKKEKISKPLVNIGNKFQSIQSLLSTDIIDLDDHHNCLLGTKKYMKKHINSLKKQQREASSKIIPQSNSVQNLKLIQNNSQRSLNFENLCRQRKQYLIKISNNNNNIIPMAKNIKNLKEQSYSQQSIPSHLDIINRSKSVAQINKSSPQFNSLMDRQQSVIEHVKTVNSKQIADIFNQSKDAYGSIQYYNLLQNPLISKIENETRSRSVMQSGVKEMTYNNKKTIKSSFPIPRVEVRKAKAEDDEKAFEIFEQKLKKISNDDRIYESYRYKDGQKIYTEKEMILRSKLYKIDTVISGYFKHTADFNTGSQVVKINDTSTYPTKTSNRGQELLLKMEINKKAGLSTQNTPKFSLQIGNSGSQAYGPSSTKVFKKFLNGDNITDHQGIQLSASGTQFNNAAKIAIPEKELEKINKQKIVNLKMLGDTPQRQDSVEEEEVSPQNKLKNYYREKRIQEEKAKESLEMAKQKISNIYKQKDDFSLKEISEMHKNFRKQQNRLKTISPSNKTDELAPEILDIIDFVRKSYKIKSQKQFSKKMQKKLMKFNHKLRSEMKNSVYNSPYLIRDDDAFGITQKSFFPMVSTNQFSNANQFKDGMKETLNSKSNDSINQYEGSLTLSSLSESSSTHMSVSGSNANTTMQNFKMQLNNNLSDELPITNDDVQKDLLTRLLKEEIREKNIKILQIKTQKTMLKQQQTIIQKSGMNKPKLQSSTPEPLKEYQSQQLNTTFNQQTVSSFGMHQNKQQLQKKDEYMLQRMVQNIKERDHHNQQIKVVQQLHKQNGHQKQSLKLTKSVESEEQSKSTPSTPVRAEETVLDVLSTINLKMIKKTEKQKEAESQALQAFLFECEKRNIMTKEILKNLKDKKLMFVNTTVDADLKMALYQFISTGIKRGEAFDSVVFCQNNFNDETLSQLLEGLGDPGSKIKSLVSIKNQIGPQSLKSLLKVIQPQKQIYQEKSQINKNLQELVLNDSKLLQQQMMPQLLAAITTSCSQSLRILGLANQNFDDHSCQELISLVGNVKSLRKLDLSFVKVIQFKNFINVLDILATENKNLQYLNIGGMSYLGNKNDPNQMRTRQRFMESIVFLIQESQSLTHLNLTGCFPGIQVLKDGAVPLLTTKVIIKDIEGEKQKEEIRPFDEILLLFSAISKSISLQSIHYSGNSINQRTLNTIKKVMKLENNFDFKNRNSIKEKELENMDIKDIQVALKAQQNERINKKVNDIVENAKELVLKKQLISIEQQDIQNQLIQQQFNKKKKADLRTDFQFKKGDEQAGKQRLSIDQCHAEHSVPGDDRYVFQRILGHQEIQYGYKWCLRDICWICEGWSYVFFVWSPKLAFSGQLYTLQNPQWLIKWEESIMKKNNISNTKQIYDFNHTSNNIVQNQEEIHNCPRIFGPATNYEYKKMIPIQQFTKLVLGNNRSWLRIYETDKESERLNELNEQMFKKKPDLSEIQSINREWPYMIRNYLRQGSKISYMSLSKFIRYGTEPEETYFAFATMLPPQQNNIFVVQSKQVQKISIIHQKFPYRSFDAQKMQKRVKRCRLQRRFELKDSVFSSWKVDLEKHYKKCFNADMKYSKIYKFVKDPDDFKAVSKILLDNYELIFEQYVHGQGFSNYPSVSMIDFTNICHTWRIVNRRDLSISDIDRLFFAVNFEEIQGETGVDLEDNPDKELCRYEFFEIIVRMAKLKFENQKLGLTVAASLEKLLKQYIYQATVMQRWHSLRKRDVWTLEVNDVLDANQEAIRKFLSWWIKTKLSKQGRKILLMDDIKEICNTIPRGCDQSLRQECQLSVQQVILAFANSKFLIIDEMTHAHQLTEIKPDEFMEFICRLADFATFKQDQELQLPNNDEQSDEDIANPDSNKNQLMAIKQNIQQVGKMEPVGQQIATEDKLVKIIDLLLKLMSSNGGPVMKAVKPTVLGLGDAESDYDQF